MSWREKLQKQLQDNHRFENGVWYTAYDAIPNIKVFASSCNGSSGIGRIGTFDIYWYRKLDGSFVVEDNKR